MKARLFLLCSVLVVTAGSVAGCGREVPAAALVGTTSTAPADRVAMPPLTGNDLDGNPLALSDLRGRVVVVNGWASWCAPCRDEMPALAELGRTANPDDVAVLGINVSDSPGAAAALVEELSVTYPSLVDDNGALWATIPGAPPKALPSTVVVDRNGRIATTIVGEVDADELDRVVRDLASESA